MKKLLLSTTALLAMTAMAAAADLPRRTVAPAPVVAVAPVFTWTGFYAGISGGYLWNDTDVTITATELGPVNLPAFLGVGRLDVESDGFLIGGTIGGNVQFGMFVAGIEADLSYADVGGSATGLNSQAFTPPNRQFTVNTQMDSFGTVRGRVGLAFDRFMIYGTGGLAFASLETSAVLTNPITGVSLQAGRTGDEWEVGYTVGVGAEFAFTNNLTAKIEYLYYEFDDVNLRTASANNAFTGDYRVERSGDLIRGGINFKF